MRRNCKLIINLRVGEGMMNLFTPRRSKVGDARHSLYISNEDAVKVFSRRTRYLATVTDILTGMRYQVQDAACNLRGCHCDSIVIGEVPA